MATDTITDHKYVRPAQNQESELHNSGTNANTYDRSTNSPTCLPTYRPVYLPSGRPTNLPAYQPTTLPTYRRARAGVVTSAGSCYSHPATFRSESALAVFVLPPSQIHGKCLDALQLRLHFDVLQHRQTASQYSLLDTYSRWGSLLALVGCRPTAHDVVDSARHTS